MQKAALSGAKLFSCCSLVCACLRGWCVQQIKGCCGLLWCSLCPCYVSRPACVFISPLSCTTTAMLTAMVWSSSSSSWLTRPCMTLWAAPWPPPSLSRLAASTTSTSFLSLSSHSRSSLALGQRARWVCGWGAYLVFFCVWGVVGERRWGVQYVPCTCSVLGFLWLQQAAWGVGVHVLTAALLCVLCCFAVHCCLSSSPQVYRGTWKHTDIAAKEYLPIEPAAQEVTAANGNNNGHKADSPSDAAMAHARVRRHQRQWSCHSHSRTACTAELNRYRERRASSCQGAGAIDAMQAFACSCCHNLACPDLSCCAVLCRATCSQLTHPHRLPWPRRFTG